MKIFIDKKLAIFNNFRQKGFFHLLSANVLIQIVAFGSQLFVAGILAPEDIGRIKIIQTYLSIASIIAGMGFNASTLKLCSENRSKTEQIALFKSALFFTLISTASAYLGLLLINHLGFLTTDKTIQLLIPLGLLPIITNSLFMVVVAYFQATKEIKLMSGLVSSNKLISIVLILFFAYFWGIYGYYWAYNIGFILMLFFCFWLTKNIFHSSKSIIININEFKTHWKYAKLTTITNIFSELSAYADLLIISFFIKDMQQIGYYGFALTITVIIRLLPSTVQQIAVPFFSSASHSKEMLLSKFKYYNKILYLVVLITLALLLIVVPIMLQYLLGGKYENSIQFFIPLAIGWSLRQLLQLQVGIMFAVGKVIYNLYTSLLSVLFNSIILFISLNFYGLIGAAYASIPAGLFIIICSNYYFKKTIKNL